MADAIEALTAGCGAPFRCVGFELRVPQHVGVTPNQVRSWHWSKTARAVKATRQAVALVLSPHRKPTLPVTVTMTRCYPGKLDSDGAVGAMKSVRDEVAKWLGVDDSDERITWIAGQLRVSRKQAGTLIRIEEQP